MCLAIPGEVVKIEGAGLERSATVRFGGVDRQASLAFVPEARARDYVLVHAGVAISVVKPEEARRIFEYLDSIGEAQP